MKVTVDFFEFDIPNAIDLFKFDEVNNNSPHYHGVSCMKAVDVMVEMPDCYLFVEIKEYSREEIAEMLRQRGMQKGSNTHYLKNNLRAKYKDTVLYRLCENKLDKDIIYICLLNFDPALLTLFRKTLIKDIPVGIANKKRWRKPLLGNLVVVDESAWNRKLTAKGFGTCRHI